MAGFICAGLLLTGGPDRTPARSTDSETLFGRWFFILFGIAPVLWLMMSTIREEWHIRPGQIVLQNRCLWAIRAVTIQSGSFAVAPQRFGNRLIEEAGMGSNYGSLPFIAIPVGAMALFLAFVAAGEHATQPQLLLSALLTGVGWFLILVPFVLDKGWKEMHPAPARSALAEGKSKALLLRTGRGEYVLTETGLSEGTKELNSLATWFGQQVGWPVEGMAVSEPSAETVTARKHDRTPGAPVPTVDVPKEPAYDAGVPAALPLGWTTQTLPDGALRLVPGYIRSQRSLRAIPLLALMAALVMGSLAFRWDNGFVIYLAPIAFLALWLFGTGEAWIIGRGRFEVHQRKLGIWKRRRFDHGALMVQPRAEGRMGGKPDILPLIGYAALTAMWARYTSAVRPMLPHDMQTGVVDAVVIVAGVLFMAAAGLVYYEARARMPAIQADSQLYLRATQPGADDPEIVDLLANNRRSRSDPGWTPAADELRSFAAWLAYQTGWSVVEVE